MASCQWGLLSTEDARDFFLTRRDLQKKYLTIKEAVASTRRMSCLSQTVINSEYSNVLYDKWNHVILEFTHL